VSIGTTTSGLFEVDEGCGDGSADGGGGGGDGRGVGVVSAGTGRLGRVGDELDEGVSDVRELDVISDVGSEGLGEFGPAAGR